MSGKTLNQIQPNIPVDSGFVRYRSSLLFCDIRGFTQFFDRSPPDDAYIFVRSVLQHMHKIVDSNHGKIINLTGDGFLAQFGFSETEQTTHESDAVRCAICIRKELSVMNRDRHFDHAFTFSVGIGINSGLVAAGLVDYSGDSIYLVLGDVVNTAARIESLCKFFSVDVLISETTEEAVRGQFKLLPMAPRELRGKAGLYRTFWVLPTNTVNTPEKE